MAASQPSQAAVARHFAKDVTLFDGPMAVRTIHTMYRPTSIQLLSSSLAAGPGGGPLVAVTEGPQLSIWDVRGHGRGARVAKLSPGLHQGHLFCMAAADDGGMPLIGGWVGGVGGWMGGRMAWAFHGRGFHEHLHAVDLWCVSLLCVWQPAHTPGGPVFKARGSANALIRCPACLPAAAGLAGCRCCWG